MFYNSRRMIQKMKLLVKKNAIDRLAQYLERACLFIKIEKIEGDDVHMTVTVMATSTQDVFYIGRHVGRNFSTDEVMFINNNSK